MLKKSFALFTLVGLTLTTASSAVFADHVDVSITDYSKSTFVIDALDSQTQVAKLAYKLNDIDSIATGVEKAQAVAEEIIGNSTMYGYSELSTHVTTNVQDGNDIYVVVETAFLAKTEPAMSDNTMLYSHVVQSNKEQQMAIVRSVMDNSFTF